MKSIANFLSIIFFPLFIPIYGTILLFSLKHFSFYPQFYIKSAFFSICTFGLIIPLLSIFILYKLKIISDLHLKDKKDRFLPYFCTALSYIVCATALFRLAMPMFMVTISVAISVALFINAIINIWWKISAHMTGIGGLFGGILCVSYHLFLNPYEWIIIIVIIAGMLAASRLYLNAHTPGQVVAGFANGTFCTLIIPNLNFGWIFTYLL